MTSEKSAEIMAKQEPLDRAIVQRVKDRLAERGIVLEQSAECDRYLISQGMEAATYASGTTIVMHTNVSASGFFEELIHLGQIRSGRAVYGDERNRLLLEIEAKERLIKYRNAYKITDYEIEVLTDVLKQYRIDLETLEKGGA